MKIIEPHLSPTARKIAEKRYLRTDMSGKVIETPGQMFWRVARHMAKAEINWPAFAKASAGRSTGKNGNGNGVSHLREIAEAFYERMVNFKFVCAGKAMFEAGNPGGTGQLSSCFVLPVEDNIQSIFKTLGDAAVVHKNNGGTGFNFSRIRPRGDKVKNVPNAASGPVDFLAAYSAALSKILQGAKRQGANIGILNADHPDIFDFITLKDEDGTIKNFNISVGVSDEFMRAVRDGKMWNLINPRTGETVRRLKAAKLFRLIVERAHLSGDPGLMFLDNTNRDNPTPQIGRIEATNPCVTGDALIATEHGLMCFEDLYRRYHNPGRVSLSTDHRVITGSGIHPHWSQAFFDQGEKQIYRLVTKSGFHLKATADHKIMTTIGWKKLADLNGDDHVLIQSAVGRFSTNSNLPFAWSNRPVGDNGRTYQMNLPTNWSRQLGQLLGWLVGDGFIRLKDTEGYVVLTFGQTKQAICDHFSSLLSKWYGKVKVFHPTPRTIQLKSHSKFLAEYFYLFGVLPFPSSQKRVPAAIFTAPREAVIGFLQGLFSSDGTVGFVPGKSAYVRLTSKSRRLLEDVQLLLINMGIMSRIYNRSRKSRKDLFPEYTNIVGEKKRYSSDGILWELEISKTSVVKFLDEIGFLFNMHSKKINRLRAKTYYKTVFSDKVVSVKPAGMAKVYDLTEPITHSFIANGLVVSNCGEIPLLPYESCNLTSICLQNHIKAKWEDRSVKLDNEVRSGKSHLSPQSEAIPASHFTLHTSRFSDLLSVLKKIDWTDLEKSVRLGVRFLDNMIEVNTYAIPEIEQMVKHGNRRIGLGVMGFSHMLVKLGISYNSSQAVDLSEKLAKFIRQKAQDESMKLAKVRGNFPNWDVSIYAGKHPMRNCAVTMIAPTGTTAMLADTSSGIEPIFSLVTKRRTFFEDDKRNKPTKELYMVDRVFEEELKKVLSENSENSDNRPPARFDSAKRAGETGNIGKSENQKAGNSDSPTLRLSDFSGPPVRDVSPNGTFRPSFPSVLKHIAEYGLSAVQGLPDWFYKVFVTTHDIAPEWHVKIQAAWQKHFDNSISKTINFSHHASVDDVEKAYMLAWKLGCKGITIYRDGSKKDQVLNLTKTKMTNDELRMTNENSDIQHSTFNIQHFPLRPGSGPANVCPECGAAAIAENGCVTCHSCGWSKCSV